MLGILKIFKFGVQSFARNFWLAILTISILVLLLLSINGLIIINFITDEASKVLQEKVDVTIYLKSDASVDQSQSLKTYLSNLPSVESVEYVTPTEALGDFKALYKDKTEVLDSLDFLDSNPFGGYLVVKTTDVNDYRTVLAQLDTPVYREIIENKDFTDHESLINTVNSITSYIKQFIIAISIFFAFIALVIIFNTVKIAIYTHKEEIGIMKLVGASNWFVRMQFVFEALLYSLAAALISMILIFPIISLVQPKVFEFFNNNSGNIFYFYRQNLFSIFAQQLLLVSLLSAFSASLAIGRYLKK